MINNIVLFCVFLLLFSSCMSTVPPSEEVSSIKIIRDQWGVPHIYAPTDKEVIYGLAWAQCEDDFNTMQEQMLALRGQYGEVKGKDGIIADFGIKFMGLRETVEARYEKDLSPEFKVILEHFVDAVNSYAALHPEEILLDDLFPLREQDIIAGYLLGLVEMSGAGKDLQKILEGKIKDDALPKGSNAIAISRNKTTDGKTYLAINSHQPLEGWYSWYEAHLMSNEGLNILGGTFPGAVSIFHGVNENLGWAHTVNHPDLSDVYRLTMHPDKTHHYRFDGEWLELEKRVYWSWLKLWSFIKIPIRKSIFYSKYGPTFETENGFYAWRYVAGMDIRAAEQWYRMNKAQDFNEFKKLLEWQAIPCTNLVYADKEDNIYYLSMARQPKRHSDYNWKGVLPGDTSATLWTDFYPMDSLPQVLNPPSGYVFNTNNTPFSSSDSLNNPDETLLNRTMGYQSSGVENNRSSRFMELIVQYDSLSYVDFKRIKFDQNYPQHLTEPRMVNLELLMNLDAEKYPNISKSIELLQKWDRNTNMDNTSAAFFIVTLRHLIKHLKESNRYERGSTIKETDAVLAIKKASQEMMEKFNQLEIPLGDMQRHIRGEVSLPLGGGPDVLGAMYSRKQEDGLYKGMAGESYIELARFGENGVELETVNAYGTSAKAEAAHFTDQMEAFTKQQLKPMSLDKDKAFENAVRVYSPKKVQKI